MIQSFLASLPSPGSSSIDIGPLELRAYGLMIAIGVLVGAWLFGRRLTTIGVGGPEDASAILLWAVPAGVIGARLYHVATEWERFSDAPGDILKVWKGGLGVPGGILLGTIVAVVLARRRGLAVQPFLWAAAPAIPLAQAIGRWGNWWNQELFGRPTDLPWGLEIDADKTIAAGFDPGTLFHPTFLYESLWNLALTVVLIVIGRRVMNERPIRLLAMYVIGYGVGRFWIEGLRIDAAKEGGGLRLNQWMAIVLVVGGLAYLLYCRLRPVAQVPSTQEDELPSTE
ncbi:MAG: prolipoprotein diacylglyceryl transferase [Actinomycetota bacterium]